MIMNKYLAIVICHGDLANSLKNNVKQLFGEVNQLHTFTNTDKSIEILFQEIQETLALHQDFTPIFFVDLRGGSCWRVAKQLSKDHADRFVLSGVNTAMLIQFLTKSAELDNVKEFCDLMVEKSRQAILGE